MQHIVSRGHTRPLTEISFVEDGQKSLLVSSAHDKLPQVRDGETGDWIGSFQGHKGAVWSAKIDVLTRTLAATGSGDFTAKLWCASSGKELYEFKHKHIVRSVDFSNDTLQIATGCQDGLVRVFQTAAPEAVPTEIRVAESGINTAVTKVQWTSETGQLLIGKRSGTIELWDVRQPSTAPTNAVQMNPIAPVTDMELSLEHNILMTACGQKVYILDAKTLAITKEIVMPQGLSFAEEGGVSLSPDGLKFITGGSDLWLREIDAVSGEVLRVFKGHHGPVRCVRYHPSGNVVASGSEDGTIRLWDLQSPVSNS